LTIFYAVTLFTLFWYILHANIVQELYLCAVTMSLFMFVSATMHAVWLFQSSSLPLALIGCE